MRQRPGKGLSLRFSKITTAAGVAAVSILALATTAIARPGANLPRATVSLMEDGETKPTRAWVKFCAQTPEECEIDASEPESMALTHKVWATILDVNVWVNSAITPVTDQGHWGIEDRWDYPEDGIGDCVSCELSN